MFTFPRPGAPSYHIILPEDSESSSGSDLEGFGEEKRHSLLTKWSKTSRRSRILIIAVVSIVLTFILSAGFFELGYTIGSRKGSQSIEHLQDHDLQLEHPVPEIQPPHATPLPPTPLPVEINNNNKKTCTNPAQRKEWRSMSKETRKSYLDAVTCLAHTPSVLEHLGTVYDDFPWVHLQMAHTTHGNASFLSWHRRFIHLYEKHLQQLCGYNGTLPYWDWTLDWESLSDSPVFSSTLGFGGDGDLRLPVTVGGGRCVTTGPLAGHLRPLLYGNETNPHCLSRGFRYGDKPIEALSPDAVGKVLEAEDYKSFLLGIENGAHNAIPNAVRGDFFSFTAPYDPLSILHHAQLDRLWLQWQRRDAAGGRFREYTATRESSRASLEDSLWMGGLEHHGGDDVLVRDVMDPEVGDLCYRYS
ncbi:tyrosinase [Cladorrhinum sp. PSN332]|nr:tyrosinase [Cladorrhinum sp. PSN332]